MGASSAASTSRREREWRSARLIVSAARKRNWRAVSCAPPRPTSPPSCDLRCLPCVWDDAGLSLRRLLGRSDHDTGFGPARRHAATSSAWQARLRLAASHPLADKKGFSEGIFNPFSPAVPRTCERYLQNPLGLH